MARRLNIPKPKMALWCHFSAALVQKAVARDTDGVEGCYAILLKHCADEPGVHLLKELCSAQAADVATTVLAALPADARNKVSRALTENPEQKRYVLEMIGTKQQVIRDVVADFAERHPELKEAVA